MSPAAFFHAKSRTLVFVASLAAGLLLMLAAADRSFAEQIFRVSTSGTTGTTISYLPHYGQPTSIKATPTDLFWSRGGTVPTPISTSRLELADSGFWPTFLRGYTGPMDADATHFYWYQSASPGQGHAIARTTLSNSSSKPIDVDFMPLPGNWPVQGGSGMAVHDLEVAGGRVYVVTSGPGPHAGNTVWSAPSDGSGFFVPAPLRSEFSGWSIESNEDGIYWRDNTNINFLSHEEADWSGDALPQVFYPIHTGVSGPFAVNETHIFWTKADGIWSKEFGTPGPGSLIHAFTSPYTTVSQITASTDSVFWTPSLGYPAVMPPKPVLATVPATPDGANGWFVSNPSYALTTAPYFDTSINYRFEGRKSPWQVGGGMLVGSITGDGANRTIEFSVLSGGGNWRDAAAFKIDTHKPVTTHEVLDTPEIEDGETDFAPVELTANDETSGVDLTEYKLDGSEPQVYEGDVILVEPCSMLEYRSTDNAGNIEDWQSFEYTGSPCGGQEPEPEICEGGGAPPCNETSGECEGGGEPPCDSGGDGECEDGGEPPCGNTGGGGCEDGSDPPCNPGGGQCENGATNCSPIQVHLEAKAPGKKLAAGKSKAVVAVRMKVYPWPAANSPRSKLCISVPKSKVRVLSKRCVTLKSANTGATVRTPFRIKLKRKMRGSTATIRFTLSAEGHKPKRTSAKIRQSRG